LTAGNGVSPDAVHDFTLTVNQPPAITSAAATTFVVGTAGHFTVTTTGFPTASITLPPGALPSGVAFTDNGDGTATLAGTPAAGTGGTYTLTLTAGNGVSPDAVQTFTLTVLAPQTDLMGVRIQGGQQQRSLLTFVDVLYSGAVTVQPGAFRLRRVGGRWIRLRQRQLTVNGQAVVRLTFRTGNLNRAALADGRYRLAVDGAKVLDADGRPLGGVSQVRFFRLYGATTGKAVVGRVDLVRLRQVLRREGDWRRWRPLFVPVTVADLRRLLLFSRLVRR